MRRIASIPVALQTYEEVKRLFAEGDSDGSGFLEKAEIAQVNQPYHRSDEPES